MWWSRWRCFPNTELPESYAGKYDDLHKESLRQARRLLALVGKRLRATGYKKVETMVKTGYAKTLLVDQAAAWGADLIVMGSHGRKGVNRVLLGSVSESVARHAFCSVQVVRRAAE